MMNASLWRRAQTFAVCLCLTSTATGCAASAMAEMPPAAPPSDVAMDAGGAEMAPAMEAPMEAGMAAPAPAMAAPVPGQAPMAPSRPAPPPGKSLPVSKSAPAAAPRNAKQVQAQKTVDGTRAGVEQMLIFTGRLDLEVAKKDFGTTLHEVIELSAKRGGYIHRQDDHSVTMRIPSGQFRQTMKDLEKLGDVVHRSVQAQDVTDQFHDLGVRLKSLLATRDRLQKFLDRAKTIEEVLRVEQELRRLNTEIDQIEGKRRYLAAQAAYSTITVALTPRPEKKVIVKEEKKEEPPPPPPPPPKTVSLPIEWLGDVSLDRLLELNAD